MAAVFFVDLAGYAPTTMADRYVKYHQAVGVEVRTPEMEEQEEHRLIVLIVGSILALIPLQSLPVNALILLGIRVRLETGF